MPNKALRGLKITDEAKGQVTAVFATLGVVDSDKDVMLPGAFEKGAPVRVSAYNHASWGSALPIGKGTIDEVGDKAVAHLQFFMDTTAGHDTFTVVKELGELGEWSYGYDILEASQGKWPEGDANGEDVQFLRKLKVHEVSPVILGAGVNTRTLAAKGAGDKAAIASHSTGTTDTTWDAGMMMRRCPATRAALRALHAWVDSDGDAEAKGSYKFPHHMVSESGAVGAANTRACSAGIAVLNGGRGGASIPDSDRQGVYNHLARHLRDADRDVPELRQTDAGGAPKLSDQGAWLLFEVCAFTDRLADAASRRAQDGRKLADGTLDLAGELLSAMEGLREALAIEPPTSKQWREAQKRLARANLVLSEGGHHA